jgi:hypothetical protein
MKLQVSVGLAFFLLSTWAHAQSAAFFIDHNVLQEGQNNFVNGSITSSYDGPMTLEIYNSTGELIKNYTALNQIVAGVPVAFQWDGTNGGATVASGVYLFLLKLPLGIQSKRLIVIR